MTGDKVRRIRKRLGLKQSELADQLGVHWITVSRWERDRVRITEPVAHLLPLLTKTVKPRKRG